MPKYLFIRKYLYYCGTWYYGGGMHLKVVAGLTMLAALRLISLSFTCALQMFFLLQGFACKLGKTCIYKFLLQEIKYREWGREGECREERSLSNQNQASQIENYNFKHNLTMKFYQNSNISLNKSNKTNPKEYHCGKFFLTNKFKQSKSSKSILKLQFQTQLHKPTMKTYAFIKPFD